jgi:hypothetical protein
MPKEPGFGIPALTALQAVRLAELSPPSTVMIVGGAGSVAHFAIQFAKMRGARVITTVSGSEKAAHAHGAGADEVKPPWRRAIQNLFFATHFYQNYCSLQILISSWEASGIEHLHTFGHPLKEFHPRRFGTFIHII